MKNTIHMLKSVTDTICNSFIITTEDDKLIVIDGGHYSETGYFLPYLKEVAGTDKPHCVFIGAAFLGAVICLAGHKQLKHKTNELDSYQA